MRPISLVAGMRIRSQSGFVLALIVLTTSPTAYAADSTPPTLPVVTDDGAITYSTTTLHAAWTSSDPQTGIAEYQYQIRKQSSTGALARNWTSTGTTPEVTATGFVTGSGKQQVSGLQIGTTYFFGVKARNGEGLWSAEGWSNGITVTADTTLPTGTVVINGNAASTASPQVTLTLSASDNSGTVAYMKVWNDSDPQPPAEPYATSKPWTLIAGSGLRRVFAIFRDGAGNWSNPPSEDTITADVSALPVVQITSPADGALLGAD